MPTKIKWPDGKIETVEDHLAQLWKRQGRAEIIEEVATKDVPAAPVDRSVKKSDVRKSFD
jgi:crotonobetainyl-CoA:carnitine CoA-transferase CaiB-like acyl-CoA transferase